MKEQWLADYFKSLNQYKVESHQEPLWLYRLLFLQRQGIDKQFNAELDSKKESIQMNEWYELNDFQFLILCIVWKDQARKKFSQLDRYIKLRLLNIAASNQLIAFYATSLLITFLLRDSEVQSHRELALQLLKEKDVNIAESVPGKGTLVLAGSHAEKVYCLNGQGNIFNDPLDRVFVDLSYGDLKGLSSAIKGMSFKCQYMLGLEAERVVFKKNVFEDACLVLANLSLATFDSCDCDRAVITRAQVEGTSILNSYFRSVHFQEGCLSFLDHPRAAFEVLKKTLDLKGSYFSEQALTAQEYQTLQEQKGKFHLPAEKDEDKTNPLQVIGEYTQELIQKERAQHRGPSLNWPKGQSEWRHDPLWNNSRESQICTLTESSLLNLLRFTVHATSDHYSYQSMRFEYSRGKKAFDAAQFGEFLAKEINSPPQHQGQAASITVQRVQVLHDPHLWSRYQKRKLEMKQTLAGNPISPLHEVKWHGGKELPHGLPVLDASVGECWLFHATSPEVMQKICKTGFSLKHASSKMFAGYGALGKGIYLTDMFSKAAIYVTCPACKQNPCKSDCSIENKKDNPKAVFLVRVLLGRPFQDKHKSRKYKDSLPEDHHSSWGPGKEFIPDSEFDCNEFIVANEAQVYPEFCIYYVDNPQAKNELSKSSLVPPIVEQPPELKDMVQSYHRYLSLGTLDQQLYQLSKMEDWVSDYIEEIRNKLDQKLEFFSVLLQKIKAETIRLKPQVKSRNQIIENHLQKQLPLLPYFCDAWVYSGPGIDYPASYIILLCDHFLQHYQIKPLDRRAYFYQQLGLAYFKEENSFEVIKNFNQAWLLLEQEKLEQEKLEQKKLDVFAHLFTPKLCYECYFELSLEVLKLGSEDMYDRAAWVRRVVNYYVDLVIKRKLLFEDFEHHYWEIKESAGRECFRTTLMKSIEKEFPHEHQKSPEENALYTKCINLPNDLGVRSKTARDQKHWSSQWQNLLLPPGEKSEVKVEWLEPTGDPQAPFKKPVERYLKPEYIACLFHGEDSPKKGKPNADKRQAHGRSLTKLLLDKHLDPLVFVKFYPRFPLRQYFVTTMMHRLSGYGVSSTFVNMHYKGQPIGYPVLISDPLGEVKEDKATFAKRSAEEQLECEEHLDIDALFWKYLEALALSFRDDKDDNQVLLRQPSSNNSYSLISIDPDEVLENEWATERGAKLFSITLLLKWVFDKRGWSPLVSKHYRALNLQKIVDDCVLDMDAYCQALKRFNLFTENELKDYRKFTADQIYKDGEVSYSICCEVENLFRDDDLLHLYERMRRLSKILTELETNLEKIPHDILEKMNPLLAYFYKNAYKPHLTPNERLLLVPGSEDQFIQEKVLADVKVEDSTSIAAKVNERPSTRVITKVAPPTKNPMRAITQIREQRKSWQIFCYQYVSFEGVLLELKKGGLDLFNSKSTFNYIRERVLRELRWNCSPGLAASLLKALPQYSLQYLRLSYLPPENEVPETKLVEAIKKIPSLMEVQIDHSSQMGAALFVTLATLPALMVLKVADANLKGLKDELNFARLQHLELHNVEGDDVSLKFTSPVMKVLKIIGEKKVDKVALNGEIIDYEYLDKANFLNNEQYALFSAKCLFSNKCLPRFNALVDALIDDNRKRDVLTLIAKLFSESQYTPIMPIRPLIEEMIRVGKFTTLKIDKMYSITTFEDIETLIKKSPELKELNLYGRFQIEDDKIADLIDQSCPQLEVCSMSHIFIAHFQWNVPSLFRSYFRPNQQMWLVSLTLNDCFILTSITVNSRHLSHVEIKGNPNLNFVDITSDHLQELEIYHGPKIKQIKVSSPQLKVLSIIREYSDKSRFHDETPSLNFDLLISSQSLQLVSVYNHVGAGIPFNIDNFRLSFPFVLLYLSSGNNHFYEERYSNQKNIFFDLRPTLNTLLRMGYTAGFKYLINREGSDKLKQTVEAAGFVKIAASISEQISFNQEIYLPCLSPVLRKMALLCINLKAGNINSDYMCAIHESLKVFLDTITQEGSGFLDARGISLNYMLEIIDSIINYLIQTIKLTLNVPGSIFHTAYWIILLLSFEKHVSLRDRSALLENLIEIIQKSDKSLKTNFPYQRALLGCAILYKWLDEKQIKTIMEFMEFIEFDSLLLSSYPSQVIFTAMQILDPKFTERSVLLLDLVINYLCKNYQNTPVEIREIIVKILCALAERHEDKSEKIKDQLSKMLQYEIDENKLFIKFPNIKYIRLMIIFYQAVRNEDQFSLDDRPANNHHTWIPKKDLFSCIDFPLDNLLFNEAYLGQFLLIDIYNPDSMPKTRKVWALERIRKFLDPANQWNAYRIVEKFPGPSKLVHDPILFDSAFLTSLSSREQVEEHLELALKKFQTAKEDETRICVIGILVKLHETSHLRREKSLQIIKMLLKCLDQNESALKSALTIIATHSLIKIYMSMQSHLHKARASASIKLSGCLNQHGFLRAERPPRIEEIQPLVVSNDPLSSGMSQNQP